MPSRGERIETGEDSKESVEVSNDGDDDVVQVYVPVTPYTGQVPQTPMSISSYVSSCLSLSSIIPRAVFAHTSKWYTPGASSDFRQVCLK